MDTLLARHVPGICWQCRDGGHPCDYGDDRGDCWRKGTPMISHTPEHEPYVVFYCREHAHMVAVLESID